MPIKKCRFPPWIFYLLAAGQWLHLWGHRVLPAIAIIVGVFAWLKWHGIHAAEVGQA